DFATFGAGLYAEDAALVITDSRFHGNITDNFFGSFSLGGGVCHFGPMLCILDSSFSDNLADSNGLGPGNGGAAIFSEANRVEVLRCTFTDTYVGENTFGAGGAIWHVGGAALLENCTFLRNHVGSGGGGQGHGGAIALDAGDVFHCSFIINEATTSRGGL